MTMDHLAEARRFAEHQFDGSYLNPDELWSRQAIVHGLIAIVERLELQTVDVEQLYECTQPTCGCRQDDRYKPSPEPQPEYSRCPRCGVEHTDLPGKLCYHCGLEPAGEPETVPVLPTEHQGRRWRDRGDYVWTFEVGNWVVRDRRDQISGIYRPGDGNAKFGPFTAVEEA